MSLLNYGANPLACANIRRIDFCPPHFEQMSFSIKCSGRKLLDWLYENTEGRFFIGQSVSGFDVCVGFEIHAEMSYFALVLNTINVAEYIS